MQFNDTQIETISKSFSEMSSLEDLAELMNLVNEWMYAGFTKVKPVRIKSLTYYSNSKIATNRYRRFTIAKKSGGQRVIHAPVAGLKHLQQTLSVILQIVYQPHAAAKGFVSGESVVSNAMPHIGKNYVFNIDLKDFFPSVDKPRFWKRLQYAPFNLNIDTQRLDLANRISALCFTEMEVDRFIDGEMLLVKKEVLPQGAPTSPIITNIIAERLDRKLTGLANRFGCTYTRYADDISFSSMHNIYASNSDFRQELGRIIESQNFRINQKKTRLQRKNHRQEVTGVIVNDKLNVNRRYVKQLRHWLYLWEHYGEEQAKELFKNSYLQDKGHVNEVVPSMRQVINGKLLYLKMVKGEDDATYLKLYHRFEALREGVNPVNLNKVLEIWESKGIGDAIKYYFDTRDNRKKTVSRRLLIEELNDISEEFKNAKTDTGDFRL